MSAGEAAANDSAAWYITFTPGNQYYQFRNAATGRYLSYSNGIKTLAKTKPTASDNWHLMRGRVDVDGFRGYWIIHPEENTWEPHCLQADNDGKTAAGTFDIANRATTQRWLILTLDQARTVDKTPDAIETVSHPSEANASQAVYDLQGRRVNRPSRGIYIRGGKRIVIR